MVETRLSEPQFTLPIVAKELIVHLTKAQEAPRESAERMQAIANFDNMLGASKHLFPRSEESYTQALSTMRVFIDVPQISVADAVRIWFDHRGEEDDRKVISILDNITLLGITNEAMDFLAKGWPLYQDYLQTTE